MTTPAETEPACDQARELRALVSKRSAPALSARPSAAGARSLTLVSGKGGVGKSVVALNLAIALRQQGASVGLLDASPGTGNLCLLAGQNGYWNLEHVVTGSRRLDEVVLPGPNGISLVPGAGHLLTAGVPDSAVADLSELQLRLDWLIADTGCDVLQSCCFASAADATWIVTTPEPTSIAEAYGAIKQLAAAGVSAVSILVNQADSRDHALQIHNRLRQTARLLLGSDLGFAGFLPYDAAIIRSVHRRLCLRDTDPASRVLAQFDELAAKLAPAAARRFGDGGNSFFTRLADLRNNRRDSRFLGKSVRLEDPGEIK